MNGPAAQVSLRPLTHDDVEAAVALHLAVAGEGRWIGRELPVDRDESRGYLTERLADPAAATFVALDPPTGSQVGQIGLTLAPHGVVDLGMLVAQGWRSRGVGSALLEHGLDWAGQQPAAHKVSLYVWPHNERAIGLYRKYGFVQEGVLRRHYRRRDGELWDAIVMGLLLVP